MDGLSFTLLGSLSVVAVLTVYGAIRKERSLGQSPHSRQNLPARGQDQPLRAIVQEHKILQTQYQQTTVANQTLQQQLETLVAEKAALQKTLDHAWAKVAKLETQLATATEQPNPSDPEPIASLKTQAEDISPDVPAETAASALMPKPSLPQNEDAPKTDSAETAQVSTHPSTDTSTEKEIETVYEIEDAIASEDNIHDQAISAEPNPLQGKSVAISGIFKGITPAEIKERLQAVGGRLHNNSGASTDYLVVGDTSSDTLQRAEKLKIPKLTEEQFLNLLKESEVLVREES